MPLYEKILLNVLKVDREKNKVKKTNIINR